MNLFFIAPSIIGYAFSFLTGVNSSGIHNDSVVVAPDVPNSCYHCFKAFNLEHRDSIDQNAYNCSKPSKCAENQVCGAKIAKPHNNRAFYFRTQCFDKKDCDSKTGFIYSKLLNFKDSIDFTACCYTNVCNIPKNLPMMVNLLKQNSTIGINDNHDKTCNEFEKNHKELKLSRSQLNYVNVKNNDNLLITMNQHDYRHSEKYAIKSIWYVKSSDASKETQIISFKKNKKGSFIVENANKIFLEDANIFYATEHSIYICNITKKNLGVYANKQIIPNLPSSFFYIILKNNDTLTTPKLVGTSININLKLILALKLINLLIFNYA